jgi:protein-S-isoprenylcysteine O-methyltransferase Ste14
MSEHFLYLLTYALLLTSGLVILRIVVRREYGNRGQLAPLVATLQAGLFIFYGGFPALYLPEDWPAVSVNQVQHAVGLFLLLGGLALLLYGMVVLGLFRSIGRGEQGLEQAGLYRFTRNPQALACGSYVLGFTLLWPSWFAVGWAALYAILIHAMVLTEEEHLQRIHGDRYNAYRRQVPRYLPWRSTRRRSP